MKKFDWEGLIVSLENWRDALPKDSECLPSVSTVAEKYRRAPWAVLASTLISLRTKDKVTLAASKALKKTLA
jgi:endonuclease-3